MVPQQKAPLRWLPLREAAREPLKLRARRQAAPKQPARLKPVPRLPLNSAGAPRGIPNAPNLKRNSRLWVTRPQLGRLWLDTCARHSILACRHANMQQLFNPMTRPRSLFFAAKRILVILIFFSGTWLRVSLSISPEQTREKNHSFGAVGIAGRRAGAGKNPGFAQARRKSRARRASQKYEHQPSSPKSTLDRR